MSKLKNKSITPSLVNLNLHKFTQQFQNKLPNLLKIVDLKNKSTQKYINPQLNPKQSLPIQIQNNDIQLFQQKLDKYSEKFTELWNQVSKIKNPNEKQQLKQVMSYTLPIEKQLQEANKKLQGERIECSQRLNQLYQDLHKIYQIFGLKNEQLKIEEINRKKQIPILKQKYKNLLTSELYDILNQKESYKKLIKQIQQIKAKILYLNTQIQKFNNKKKQLKKIHKKNLNDLITYYYQSLKYGYDYRDYGIKWIIIQLNKLNQNVKLTDLPDILDRKSKEYLLYGITQNNNYQSKLPTIRQKKALSSMVKNISDNAIQHNIHMKKIYLNTKNYLQQMIKNRESMDLDLVSNPQIPQSRKQEDYSKQVKEYERILWCYPRDIQNRVLKLVFGASKNEIRLKF